MESPERILIIRTDRLGDVILSTPVITNLRHAFPKAYIAFMCRPYTKQVVEGNPYLNEVILYDKDDKHKGIWASTKFAFTLRKKKFDWAIILHPTNRVNNITFLAGIRFRVGWDKKMGFSLTKRIPHKKQEGKKHELEYSLDILRELAIPIVDKKPYFPITKIAEESIRELLKTYGLGKEDKFIVLHPSASCTSRRWPHEHFSKLIKILQDKKNFPIIVVSVEEEKEFCQKIVDENKVIDLRGKLDISELGALLKRTTLFISNDSGPVHIASSLNTPVISIFSRKNSGLSPLRWGPLGNNSVYIHKDVGCTQCLAHNCVKGFLCLREIAPEEVAVQAFRILELVKT
jgi:heptosyltransferase-2